MVSSHLTQPVLVKGISFLRHSGVSLSFENWNSIWISVSVSVRKLFTKKETWGKLSYQTLLSKQVISTFFVWSTQKQTKHREKKMITYYKWNVIPDKRFVFLMSTYSTIRVYIQNHQYYDPNTCKKLWISFLWLVACFLHGLKSKSRVDEVQTAVKLRSLVGWLTSSRRQILRGTNQYC